MSVRWWMRSILIALVGLIALIFAAAYLYAHLAGSWASEVIVPIPVNSTLIQQRENEDNRYRYRLRFYKTVGTLESVRQAYAAQGFPMTPLSGKLAEDDTKSCSVQVDVTKHSRYMLLFTAAYVSFNSGLQSYETIPDCFYICAYKAPIEAQPDLNGEEIAISDNEIAVAIRQCWPNW